MTTAQSIADTLITLNELLDIVARGGQIIEASRTPDGAAHIIIRFGDDSEAVARNTTEDGFYIQ